MNEKKETEVNHVRSSNVEQNKYTLDLVNVWINSADQKIGTAFGIFSAIFAAFGFLVGSKLADLKYENCCWYCVLLVISILSIAIFVVGLAFFFFALKPDLTSDSKVNKYTIFYEEVKSFQNADDYYEACAIATEDDFNKEVCKEIYYNSVICSKKMYKFRIGLTICSVAILVAVAVVIALLILV